MNATYKITQWFNETGRRAGWLISDANGAMVDIWPTKKQAQEWVRKNTVRMPTDEQFLAALGPCGK